MQATKFGELTANLLINTKRLFVFKFSQTLRKKAINASGIMKNGLLYADNEVEPYNIGDSSRTFEVCFTSLPADHQISKRMTTLSQTR